MSAKSLPLLFINMGGEMMYILDQRLKAQSVPTDKTKKVLNDIIGTMFNAKFIEELFKPQELYSKRALRTVYDRLAHSSIMRLNTASMDKLYDLMVMAVKYQVLLCKRPQDVILVTLNHLDVMRTFVEGSPVTSNLVENAFRQLLRHYGSLDPGAFMLIRQTLLAFMQDIHIRVSIFLKDKVQTNTGRFVLATSGQLPVGIEIPGKIRLCGPNDEKWRTVDFKCGGNYILGTKEGSLEMFGDRVTPLGTNMYSSIRPSEASVSHYGGASASSSEQDFHTPDPRAKAQLDLLSKLIGASNSKRGSVTEFKLNLFNTDEEEEQTLTMTPTTGMPEASGYNVITIDASKKKQNAELSHIMADLNIESSGDTEYTDDLLALMDSVK